MGWSWNINSGITVEVERINKNEGDAFVAVLRDKLEENRKEKIGKVDQLSPMDEIKKAKELLDSGVITEEEFENIKKKYLWIKIFNQSLFQIFFVIELFLT